MAFVIDINATQKSKMGTQCTGSTYDGHPYDEPWKTLDCPYDTCNNGGCLNGCASYGCTLMRCFDNNKDENQLCILRQPNCKDGLKCVDQEDGCDNGIGKCVKSG